MCFAEVAIDRAKRALLLGRAERICLRQPGVWCTIYMLRVWAGTHILASGP
jgi:hypothetical protein